jgi:hypothetical protein
MPRFDLDDFDPYTATPPVRESRPRGGSLCNGCKHAHLYRRRDSAEPSVYCHELLRYVRPDIVECSQFTAVAAPTLMRCRGSRCPSTRAGGSTTAAIGEGPSGDGPRHAADRMQGYVGPRACRPTAGRPDFWSIQNDDVVEPRMRRPDGR